MPLTLPPSPFALSPLFSDGMVLQRKRPVPVFGEDAPGTTVTVRLGNDTRTARVPADGRWRVELPAHEAGGPFTMSVDGTQHREIRDVLFGEVWIASGQSNMEWTIDAGTNIADARTDTPNAVRMFTVQKATSEEPITTLKGMWEAASPETVGRFSAIAYQFARRLHASLDVPVGIIHSSWGGTNAESWTSIGALAENPVTRVLAERKATSMGSYPAALARYGRDIEAVQNKVYPEINAPGPFAEWAQTDYNDSSWESVTLPNKFPDAFDGVVWYRTVVDLTADEAAKPQTLSLGPTDDVDATYVNGVKVGQTDLRTPGYYQAKRLYTVPAGTLKAGRNVVAVRVFDMGGGGGFFGTAEDLNLAGHAMVSARTKVERTYTTDPRGGTTFPNPPVGPNDPNLPTALFNAMINPLIGYGVQGAIWYQGENNAGRAEQYRTLFPLMIEDWRAREKKAGVRGDFPFYFVSLASFMARRDAPAESAWAELREAQRETSETVPNTGQAITIDVGDANDIHPKRKREVGDRLALQALRKTYGKKDVIADGPEPKRVELRDGTLEVIFPGQKLLTSDGKAPRGFWVCDLGGVWKVADARIQGDRVVLTAPGMAKPMFVRYAWADNPDANLVGPTGLPAGPFRSDYFRFSTADNR